MSAMGEDTTETTVHRWCLWAVLALAFLLRVFYASYGLHYGRFEDEQYSLRNIRSILYGKTLYPRSTYYPYPLFNLPPAGLVALSERLHEVTGNEKFRVRLQGGATAPATYFLCRFVQCLAGALGVWLLYLLGREIRGPTTGLLAAAILSWVPWHIQASAYFKPDGQLVTMVVLALWLSLRALRSGRLGVYAAAGLAIAMAMSSKLTGGLVAMPLVFGVARALRVGDRADRPRALRGLAVAGAASALAFVVMNPYWQNYPAWLGSLGRDYAKRAGWFEMTRLDVPGRVVDFVLDPYTLGGVLGTVALVGFGLWLVGLFFRPLRLGIGVDAALVLVTFPLVYTLAYAAKTAYFKPNNFLPVLPILVLALAWLLALGLAWARSSRRWRGLGPLAPLGAVGLMLWTGAIYSYRNVIPTTMDFAKHFLGRGLKGAAGHVVLSEAEAPKEPRWYASPRFGEGKSARAIVDSLAELGHRRVSRAGGEIFPAQRLDSAEGDFYSRRVERVREGQIARFGPRLFRARGPELVAIRHFAPARGETEPRDLTACAEPSCGVVAVPDEAVGHLVSLRLWVPLRPADEVERAWLTVDGHEWPLHPAARRDQGAEFVSEKLELEEGAQVQLSWESEDFSDPDGLKVVFHLW